MSYVTGYGARPMRHPHHRFWARQFDPKAPEPPPGVLSGGPNSQAMTDPVSRALKGTCAPQACWRDDARAFTFNEVAINWNAPLFWAAAFLDSTAFKAASVTAPARRTARAETAEPAHGG